MEEHVNMNWYRIYIKSTYLPYFERKLYLSQFSAVSRAVACSYQKGQGRITGMHDVLLPNWWAYNRVGL